MAICVFGPLAAYHSLNQNRHALKENPPIRFINVRGEKDIFDHAAHLPANTGLFSTVYFLEFCPVQFKRA